MVKLVLNGPNGQSQELPLPPGLSRVGRNDANDVQIEHPSVSSFHCEITSTGSAVIIKDLGSTNGTFIERQPVQEAVLAPGQRLQLGSVELVLDAPPPSETVGQPQPVPAVQAPNKPPISVRLAHSVPSAEAAAQVSAPALAITPASAPAAHPVPPRHSFQADRPEAETQAKLKIGWGDPPEEVIKYLRMQGFSIQEAADFVNALVRERVRAVRGIGVRKILTGFGLICLAGAGVLGLIRIGYVQFTLLGLAVMVAVYGAWLCLKGTFMILAPKSEPGDLADK